jgi:hypothetical protein
MINFLAPILFQILFYKFFWFFIFFTFFYFKENFRVFYFVFLPGILFDILEKNPVGLTNILISIFAILIVILDKYFNIPRFLKFLIFTLFFLPLLIFVNYFLISKLYFFNLVLIFILNFPFLILAYIFSYER